MLINFEKWHGCRNDFIVLWSNPNECSFLLDSLKRQASRLCAKDGSGIGADGILVLERLHHQDLIPRRLTIINRDGSEAANCGNGLRCAALSIYRRILEEAPLELPASITISIQGRENHCHFLSPPSKKNEAFLPWVAVSMGEVRIDWENPWHEEVLGRVTALSQSLGIPALKREVHTAELGNRHVLIILEKAAEDLLAAVALPLQTLWPEDPQAGGGINVHLVLSSEANDADQRLARQGNCAPVSEVHQAQTWERGVGPTSACGSGAVAIVAAVLSSELAERSHWMAVQMPGGRLYVQHKGRDFEAVLAGPGEFVFSGRVEV